VIDRLAAAIDQLASDVRNDRGAALDGTADTRIAELWQMVSDLDPELARRARRYAAPADGAPSE
jgi:thioredoxin-like negative regulator of GroEL